MTITVALESQRDNKELRFSWNHQKALQKINDSNKRNVKIQQILE